MSNHLMNLIVLLCIISFFGCKEDDAIQPPPSNNPPTAPSNPSPSDNATAVSHSPVLSWSCSDPEGDSLTYDVYFGTVNPPATVVVSNQTYTTLARIGLLASTTYYWKLVAKDNHSHLTIGPVWRFTTQSGGGSPCVGTPTVTYAGRTYNTVQVGTQCWLRENMDIGTRINGTQNQTPNRLFEKYCYNNDPANCATYGGLYQWDEAMQYSTAAGVRGICPPGWHIPTIGEFDTLSTFVGGNGNALNAIGQGSGGGAGTNTSGFSALLAGFRHSDGNFYNLGNGYFWSSTQLNATNASNLYLNNYNPNIYLNSYNKFNGFSVRCLED